MRFFCPNFTRVVIYHFLHALSSLGMLCVVPCIRQSASHQAKGSVLSPFSRLMWPRNFDRYFFLVISKRTFKMLKIPLLSFELKFCIIWKSKCIWTGFDNSFKHIYREFGTTAIMRSDIVFQKLLSSFIVNIIFHSSLRIFQASGLWGTSTGIQHSIRVGLCCRNCRYTVFHSRKTSWDHSWCYFSWSWYVSGPLLT